MGQFPGSPVHRFRQAIPRFLPARSKPKHRCLFACHVHFLLFPERHSEFKPRAAKCDFSVVARPLGAIVEEPPMNCAGRFAGFALRASLLTHAGQHDFRKTVTYGTTLPYPEPLGHQAKDVDCQPACGRLPISKNEEAIIELENSCPPITAVILWLYERFTAMCNDEAVTFSSSSPAQIAQESIASLRG